MKYIFLILIILYGTIHLMGFLKAFRSAQIEQLSFDISKISGIFWLLTSILFLVSGITNIVKLDFWYIHAFIVFLLSAILIINIWQDAKFGTIANVMILVTWCKARYSFVHFL